ncbi:Protein FMP21 [Escovopsis weberi]|uniref:Succinate dehydrogenase assembly factor 4, mitochondrial n=1 Tax=Escovopsis weberi TaxID=150374 RepID=A0A0M8N391_ESCWE|nr:Protein FMP21 [Escovopsis weberi]
MMRRLPLRALRIPGSRARPYSFSARPAPPRLPDSEQSEFERLQRSAAVSSAFQPSSSSSASASASSQDSSSPGSSSSDSASPDPSSSESSAQSSASASNAASENQGVFRGAPPEFEGDTNPRTGEVGGPKNEPLRWGGKGDWSYNGRVTDF